MAWEKASNYVVSIASSYGSEEVSVKSCVSSFGSVPVVLGCIVVKFHIEASMVFANEVPTTDGGANHDTSIRFTEW